MNQISRWWVWLRRIGHCRGFGIQSPNDYWFVRYVVNEHWPYYQYATVGTDDDWLTRKMGHLCLRVANWRQPATTCCPADMAPYVKAGCRKTVIDQNGGTADLTILTTTTHSSEQILRTLSTMKADGVLMVRGIWRNQQLWQQITSAPSARICFDLYYCGIVLFDPKREKQNYIINF